MQRRATALSLHLTIEPQMLKTLLQIQSGSPDSEKQSNRRGKNITTGAELFRCSLFGNYIGKRPKTEQSQTNTMAAQYHLNFSTMFRATVKHRSYRHLAPLNATIPKPEVRATALLAPNRRVERYRPINVPRHTPARAFIGQQVHVENVPTTARTQHRSLLIKSILVHYVYSMSLEQLRQRLFDHHSSVG